MVAYIIRIAEEVVIETTQTRDAGRIFNLLRAMQEELDRLDPRDFLPSAQYDFVVARLFARRWGSTSSISGTDFPQIKTMAERVIATLNQFGGEGSQVVHRSFAFVKDTDLRQIIERDYRELRLKVFPSRAWKSTVILAGSILEAILFDQLASDPLMLAKANASKGAPKDKSKTVLDLVAGDWKLASLIQVAAEINVIPADRAKSIDQVLRDYRNFVHPKKELRAQHSCNEAEALMSVGALEGVCNILT